VTVTGARRTAATNVSGIVLIVVVPADQNTQRLWPQMDILTLTPRSNRRNLP
jgi:hypothetical protein